MAQVRKSTKYFKLVGAHPGAVRVSTDNAKDKVILSSCAIFRPATAFFRLLQDFWVPSDFQGRTCLQPTTTVYTSVNTENPQTRLGLPLNKPHIASLRPGHSVSNSLSNQTLASTQTNPNCLVY
jgi:hypothetical protein